MIIVKGELDQTYEISLGKSIFSRTSTLHIGRLLEKFGGGGHANAGACLLDEKSVEDGINGLTAKITSTKSWEWLTK
jgi:nanoRNase/pAp phosphatase (c-di-AMP/oligoRNAs hydrolase)